MEKAYRELPVGERRMDIRCEYIFELRTERSLKPQKDFQVGCDGEARRKKVQGYRVLSPYLMRQKVKAFCE